MAYHKNKHDLGKAFTKSYNTTLKNIKKRQKEYEKAYRTLQDEGQRVGKFKTLPTNKDIGTLKARISTMKEYNKIYKRYEKSISGFNEKYFEAKQMPKQHQQKNIRTLRQLVYEFEKWKIERARYVRTLPKEIKEVSKNIKDMFYRIDRRIERESFQKEERWERRDRAHDKIQFEMRIKKITEKLLCSKNMLSKWKTFENAVKRYIFDSNEDIRLQAWDTFVSYLTGEPAEEYSDSGDPFMKIADEVFGNIIY